MTNTQILKSIHSLSKGEACGLIGFQIYFFETIADEIQNKLKVGNGLINVFFKKIVHNIRCGSFNAANLNILQEQIFQDCKDYHNLLLSMKVQRRDDQLFQTIFDQMLTILNKEVNKRKIQIKSQDIELLLGYVLKRYLKFFKKTNIENLDTIIESYLLYGWSEVKSTGCLELIHWLTNHPELVSIKKLKNGDQKAWRDLQIKFVQDTHKRYKKDTYCEVLYQLHYKLHNNDFRFYCGIKTFMISIAKNIEPTPTPNENNFKQKSTFTPKDENSKRKPKGTKIIPIANANLKTNEEADENISYNLMWVMIGFYFRQAFIISEDTQLHLKTFFNKFCEGLKWNEIANELRMENEVRNSIVNLIKVKILFEKYAYEKTWEEIVINRYNKQLSQEKLKKVVNRLKQQIHQYKTRLENQILPNAKGILSDVDINYVFNNEKKQVFILLFDYNKTSYQDFFHSLNYLVPQLHSETYPINEDVFKSMNKNSVIIHDLKKWKYQINRIEYIQQIETWIMK